MGSSMIHELWVDTANGFRVQGLRRESLGNPGFLNNATVTVRVQDQAGNDVPLTLTTWPLTLNYILLSDGDYEAVLQPGDMVLTTGACYHIVYEVTDPSIGTSGPIREEAVAYIANLALV